MRGAAEASHSAPSGSSSVEQRGQLRARSASSRSHCRRQQRPGRLRGPLGGRQVEQPLQHRVHQRAAGRRRAGRLGQPVDHPEPVEQRAGHEVGRAGRGQRRPAAARRLVRSRRLLRLAPSPTAAGDRRRTTLPPARATAPTVAGDLAARRGATRPVRAAAARSIGTVAGTTPEQPPATAGDSRPDARRSRPLGSSSRGPFGIPVYISPYWFLIAGVFIVRLRRRAWPRSLHGSSRVATSWPPPSPCCCYVSVLRPRAEPLRGRPRATGCRCAGSCSTRSAGSPRSSGSRRRPAGSSWSSAAGPALSLALAAAGYGLMHVVSPDGIARRPGRPADAGPT